MPALEVASAARAALSRGKPIDCSSCTIWRCAWMSTASCRGEYAEPLGPCTADIPCTMSGLLSIRLRKACKGEQCSPPPSCAALCPYCRHMGTGPMMCLKKVREGPAAEQGTGKGNMATSLQHPHDMEAGRQQYRGAGQQPTAPGRWQGVWGCAPAGAARGPARGISAPHRAGAAGALSAASPASM